jgi:hypothetical protein
MKYRKKPVEIEAVQFIMELQDLKKLREFCPNNINYDGLKDGVLYIETLEGDMLAHEGDYIIKGVKGEFYPCREDIFELTYEKV